MRILVAVIAIVALSACEQGGQDAMQVAERGIALDVPSAWSATGFSVDVIPRRLVAASYDVFQADVEGDCGGRAAVLRLPEDGVYVFLIDHGSLSGVDADDFADELPTSGRDEPFSDERFGEFECFGPSYLFRFVLDGRALQAHIGIGPTASAERREEAAAVLRSITNERG